MQQSEKRAKNTAGLLQDGHGHIDIVHIHMPDASEDIPTANALAQDDLEPGRAGAKQIQAEDGALFTNQGGSCLLNPSGLNAGCLAAFDMWLTDLQIIFFGGKK